MNANKALKREHQLPSHKTDEKWIYDESIVFDMAKHLFKIIINKVVFLSLAKILTNIVFAL